MLRKCTLKGTELWPQLAAGLTGTAGAGDTCQTLAAPEVRHPARSDPSSPPSTDAGYPVHEPRAGFASRSDLNTAAPGLGRKGKTARKEKKELSEWGQRKMELSRAQITGLGKTEAGTSTS